MDNLRFFFMPCFGNFGSCLGLVVCAAVGFISMRKTLLALESFSLLVFCLKLCMTEWWYLFVSSLTLILLRPDVACNDVFVVQSKTFLLCRACQLLMHGLNGNVFEVVLPRKMCGTGV